MENQKRKALGKRGIRAISIASSQLRQGRGYKNYTIVEDKQLEGFEPPLHKNNLGINKTFLIHTTSGNFFVEYLTDRVVLSDSPTEALLFKEYRVAKKFQEYLSKECGFNCNVHSFLSM